MNHEKPAISVSDLEEGDIVEDYSRFHGKLQEKLEQLQELVDEEAAESYEMVVEYLPMADESPGVSITIESDEWVGNAGECGDRYFHIVMHQQGRISSATRRTDMIEGRRDYVDEFDTKNDVWKHIKWDVKGAY